MKNKKPKEPIEEKKPNKFIKTIKKKWLVDNTKTAILILIIIAIFIGINIGVQKLDITPIDLSQEKLYTLTEESKEKAKKIDKEINMYFIEYDEEDTTVDLAKEYAKQNEKIKVEIAKAENRPDLVEKYGIETGSAGIIIECGEKYKILTTDELVTYDYSTNETINIAEEKLTAALQSVSSDDMPKIYFLKGNTDLTFEDGLQYLNMYLENEINEVEELDILTQGKVPDDCDTLVITMPTQDYDDITTNAIIDYINSGRNILWFYSATAQETNYQNVNKILDMYGIKPFNKGIVRETNTDMTVAVSPSLILPIINESTATSKIKNSEGVILVNATKIETQDDEKLQEMKITKTDLLTTSEESYFRTNFENQQDEAQSDDEVGSFTLGVQMEKTLTEANEETGEPAKTSKLILYGDEYFISDIQLMQESQLPAIGYRQNKDLVLNSIAYLSNREQDITARKNTGTITYTATETENSVILAIIFLVPLAIIILGILVWIIRRKSKR